MRLSVPRIVSSTAARESVLSVGVVALLYLLVTVSADALAFSLSIPLLANGALTAALPVPLVLALGPVSLLGIPVGYAVSELVRGAVGWYTVVGAAAHLFLGYSGGKLARWFDLERPAAPSEVARFAVLGRFFVLAALSAGGAAALSAWGGEVVGLAPFYATVLGAFVSYFLLTFALGLPLSVLFRAAVSGAESRFGVALSTPAALTGRFSLRGVAAVTAVWILLGAVGSVGYRSFERISPGSFAERNLDFVLVLNRPDLFGPGAGRVQALFGALLFSVLVFVYLGPERSSGGVSE